MTIILIVFQAIESIIIKRIKLKSIAMKDEWSSIQVQLIKVNSIN